MDSEILDSEQKIPNYRFKLFAAATWGVVTGAGLALKLLHWPGSAILILIGSGGLSAYCAFGLVKVRPIPPLIIICSVACIGWFSVMLWGILFNEGHPYNKWGLLIYVSVALIWFIGYMLVKPKKRTTVKE